MEGKGKGVPRPHTGRKIYKIPKFLCTPLFTNVSTSSVIYKLQVRCFALHGLSIHGVMLDRQTRMSLSTTIFGNPHADPLGTRSGPPLVRGPQFENRSNSCSSRRNGVTNNVQQARLVPKHSSTMSAVNGSDNSGMHQTVCIVSK